MRGRQDEDAEMGLRSRLQTLSGAWTKPEKGNDVLDYFREIIRE